MELEDGRRIGIELEKAEERTVGAGGATVLSKSRRRRRRRSLRKSG